jgi:hypothetical protein
MQRVVPGILAKSFSASHLSCQLRTQHFSFVFQLELGVQCSVAEIKRLLRNKEATTTVTRYVQQSCKTR